MIVSELQQKMRLWTAIQVTVLKDFDVPSIQDTTGTYFSGQRYLREKYRPPSKCQHHSLRFCNMAKASRGRYLPEVGYAEEISAMERAKATAPAPPISQHHTTEAAPPA